MVLNTTLISCILSNWQESTTKDRLSEIIGGKVMDRDEHLWKNFSLGTELDISGVFLYNGLYKFDQMESFYYKEECFEFLYNVSIGFERLFKIAVILIEHNETTNQEKFEKELITHNLPLLIDRIRKIRKLSVTKQQFMFLSLLSNFYKSLRYSRYNKSSVRKDKTERQLLIDFISEELKIDINVEIMNTTLIDKRIRNFICRLISKLTENVYKIISDESYRLGTYTYEIRYDSKAYKIFIEKEFDFENEHIMQREVFLYLLEKFKEDYYQTIIGDIKPLKLSQYDLNTYISFLMNSQKYSFVKDEIESLYEEHKINNKRIEDISFIGQNINIDFDERYFYDNTLFDE